MIIGDTIQLKPGIKTEKPQEGDIAGICGEWASILANGAWSTVYLPNYIKKEPMTTQLNKKAKPSTKPQAEAYYVRHKPSGHGVSLAASQSSSVQVPATMIATYEDAVNEANRLAELHAGSEFVILGVVYRVKKVPVYTTEATEYSV